MQRRKVACELAKLMIKVDCKGKHKTIVHALCYIVCSQCYSFIAHIFTDHVIEKQLARRMSLIIHGNGTMSGLISHLIRHF